MEKNSHKDHCPNKKVCGSCTWSDISYKDQLEEKLKRINESFLHFGLRYECKDIIPSPKTEHYRNRMDFVINYEGKVGLREKGKWWKVIDDHTCFISMESIEEVFHICRNWAKSCGLSFYDRKADVGFLRYFVIRSTKSGEVMLNVITSSLDKEPQEEEFIIGKLKELASVSKVSTLLWSINSTTTDVSYGTDMKIISGPGYLVEEIGGFKYKISPNSFFQTNPYCAEKLLDLVAEFSNHARKNDLFLDLYCGSGFFTFPIGDKFKNIIGVEVVEDAIQDARENAVLNSKKMTETGNKYNFIVSEIENMDWSDKKPDLILLDPPRSGLHPRALEFIKTSKVLQIIYVSCNYKKFAEEMKELKNLYEIEKTVAVDMFPNTPHVELVSLLKIK